MSGFSRRRLLTAGIIGGVLAATGMKAAAQRRGGELRLALGGGGAWYPGRVDTDLARVLTASSHDCLTEVTATGELVGELAEYWDASADALVWTLGLRRGVRFHDGSPFDSDDVVASLLAHARAFPYVTDIDDVAAITPHQVRIRLRVGNADFPFLLSDPRLVIRSVADLEAGSAVANGTGLYRLVGQAEQVVALDRVGEHYKDGSAGWFDRLRLVRADWAAERTAALVAGVADAAGGLDLPRLAAISDRSDLAVIRVDGLGQLAAARPDAALVRLDRSALAALGRGEDDAAIMDLIAQAGLTLSTDPRAPVVNVVTSLGQVTEDCTLAGLCANQQDLALLHRARASADGAERAAIHAMLRAQIASRSAPAASVCVAFVDGHATSLRHADALGITAPLDGGRIAERWWFA